MLTLYVIERLLYRLAQSAYAERFVLKGALCFMVWDVQTHRPTRDLDLLGYGDNTPSALLAIFAALCALHVEDDGLVFDPQSIRISDIREEQEYHGQRVNMIAHLGKARVLIQIDIGVGDLVTPPPLHAEYPTLLEFPAPHLRIYSKESVVAEKLHAMVELDLTNSRMKDFYDIWTLARLFDFEGELLVQAIQATFARRQTAIPEDIPIALTADFANHADKTRQWDSFIARNRLAVEGATLAQISMELHKFLVPSLQAAAQMRNFNARWLPPGPWSALDQRTIQV
ncbi:MAG: nucleotidyl transferase AbiEii/AbiGii toxin family protein [Caldilineaceae bacterium]